MTLKWNKIRERMSTLKEMKTKIKKRRPEKKQK
jgi:hypothetical protein